MILVYNLNSEQLRDVAAMTDQALPKQRREALGGYVRRSGK